MILTLAVLLAEAATADAQVFRRPSYPTCANGTCGTPQSSPAPFVAVPAVAPKPLPAADTRPIGTPTFAGCGRSGWLGFGVVGPGTGRGLFGRR